MWRRCWPSRHRWGAWSLIGHGLDGTEHVERRCEVCWKRQFRLWTPGRYELARLMDLHRGRR